MLGNQSQLRNINSSSITAKGCWVNTRSIIDVNTRIRGHIIAGTVGTYGTVGTVGTVLGPAAAKESGAFSFA